MTTTNSKHVFVGLSGGVDSAVAALLLRRRGQRVTALFMKNWEEDDNAGHCPAAEDYRIANAVCERLEIPLIAINFSAEYWERVFSRFLSELAVGRTPNPDVLCNKEIKFKAFLDYALGKGAHLVATGHYARVARTNGRYQLLKGHDDNKDQSYFLYTLGQHELARVEFPLGTLKKPDVRALACEAGLPNHAKRDSTGICFIGEQPFKAFLHRYLPRRRGEIRTVAGDTKGEHDGVMYYTIGQRHGLGIGGPGEPWYVVDKDPKRNILYVAQGHGHPALLSPALEANSVHWVAGSAPTLPLSCYAKIRYRQREEACLIDRASADTLRIKFAHPQRAITPGQSVVFYDGDVCLGGAIITRALSRTSQPVARAVETG